MNHTARFALPIFLAFAFLACAKRQAAPESSNAPAPSVSTNAPATASNTPVASATPAATSTAPATSGSATKSGWWVRIHPSLTTAQAVTFQIGANKLQREEWRVWRAGEPVEFDVPAKYQQLPKLYVRGSVTPIGKIADLCLMYQNRGVEHMDFDDDDSDTANQLKTDIKCR